MLSLKLQPRESVWEKGLFLQNNQQQYPKINLEKLMQDDIWSNPNNEQVTTSPFRGIGDENIWEKIRKPKAS